jgi:hypothetical protein
MVMSAGEQMSLFMPPPAVMPPPDPPAEVQSSALVSVPEILSPEPPSGALQRVSDGVRALVHPFGEPDPNDCEWVAFMKEHRRVPMITDEKKPWEYRGWLMYYRAMCELHPDVPKRWDYWARTVQAGVLLDEPIPEVIFDEAFVPKHGGMSPELTMVDKWIELVHQKQGTWNSVSELMDWFLWGFGAADAPPKFSAELNEALYRQVNIGPLLLRPADYFGTWISAHKSFNPHAFYPTPMHVVRFMNQMTFTKDAKERCNEEGRDLRTFTVHDPCTGTGRFLLDAGNYSLNLSGIDIDPVNLAVAKVNAFLYVPWLARPLPKAITGRDPRGNGLFYSP